ncbi:MAG: Na+:solute symporter [Elusimicrobia bacterium]|nr:Na+:solute symporter [Elusimicrobiota bacterium]
MAGLDIAIILAFIIYSIYSGFRNKDKASKDLEEYFLAGRSLPGWKAGLSMAATQFAADTPLLVTGIIAVSGIFALWQMWIYALSFLMMGFVLASHWRRAGVITDAELTELRYSGGKALLLRGFKALYFGTFFNCVVLAWVFFAASRIAEPFLPWNEWLPAWMFHPFLALAQMAGLKLTTASPDAVNVWVLSANNLISVLSILLVTTFYSATGGLRSVVDTDVMQVGIMLGATLLFSAIVTMKAGGVHGIHEKLRALFAAGALGGIQPAQILAFTPDRAYNATFPLLALFALQWIIQLNSDGTGYLAQRSMACKDEKQAKMAALVFTGTQVLLRSLLWLPLGLGLLVLFPPVADLTGELLQADREGAYVRGMAELLPVGVKGLMITGMLAALASTVDTHINWGSSYWANDLFKRILCQAWLKREPSGRALVWVARGSNVMLIGIALIIMTKLSSINQAWQASLLLGAGMGPILVMRWLWWRVNAWSEIAAIAISGLAAVPLLLWVPDQALRLLIMGGLSAAASFAAIFFFGPEPKDHLARFYNLVRPKGFWHPVAVECGDHGHEGARRLMISVGAMLAAGASVFCLLVGAGSVLVGSPPPALCPSPALWVGGNIAVGLLLCPVWFRQGFKLERH